VKKFLRAGVAAAALYSAQLAAADMPVKAPLAPAAFSWTGFYLGAGGGYGSWVDPKSTVGTAIDQVQSGKGGFATVIAGFDYQFAERWVAGVYADFDLAAINGTLHDEGPFVSGGKDLRSEWFAGGRLGYLLRPATLLYATGGYTEARFSGTTLVPNARGVVNVSSLPGNTSHGAYVGAGIETEINRYWSLRAEYRNAYLGTSRFTEPITGDVFVVHPTVQTFRIDLTYKFGERPAVAMPHTVAPAFSWTGFYVGGGGGYGAWQDPHVKIAEPPALDSFNTPAGGRGGFLSAIVGYDYQFANGIVAGVYTDYDFARIKGIVNDDDPVTFTPYTEKQAWFAGSRLGYLVMPATLAFAAGGYTEAHFSAGQTMRGVAIFGPVPDSQLPGKTFTGWYVGGGLETEICRNWSLRGEYRYAGYNKQNLQGPNDRDVIMLRPAVQTVRLDLIYKFSTP
jgi:outer membrane immunogenic protein